MGVADRTIVLPADCNYIDCCPVVSQSVSRTVDVPADCNYIDCCQPFAIDTFPGQTVYWNTLQVYTAVCPPGLFGTPVTKRVRPYTYFSFISQADADAKALAAAQAAAEAALVCVEVPPELIGLSWVLPYTGGYLDPCSTSDTKKMPGSSSIVYNVTFRVRGVIEEKTYGGGITTDYWNVGGTPDADAWNLYRLTVSDPAEVYFPNAGTSFQFRCYGMDYEVTVPIRGGADLVFLADSIDCLEIENTDGSNPISVADDDPTRPIVVSQPFNGQFVQLDALSITT